MSLHLSHQAASELATALAKEFMSKQDTRGWNWECGVAQPAPIDPEFKDRKVASRWVVAVRYFKVNATLDGPAILLVNINESTVTVKESP